MFIGLFGYFYPIFDLVLKSVTIDSYTLSVAVEVSLLHVDCQYFLRLKSKNGKDRLKNIDRLTRIQKHCRSPDNLGENF